MGLLSFGSNFHHRSENVEDINLFMKDYDCDTMMKFRN